MELVGTLISITHNYKDDEMKHFIDATALFTAVGAIMHWMPEVAGLLSAVWYGIRIYEYFKKKNK